MNPTPELERIFPLCGGSSEPPRLRAPRVLPSITVTPGIVLGHRAFLRTWAARRSAYVAAASGARTEACREESGAVLNAG